jgi:SAM-dependent methyltransferase
MRCLSCRTQFDGSSWSCPACAWTPAGNGIPEFAPELARSSAHFPMEAVARMAELEQRHFWFRARSELIATLIARYFPDGRSLLEIGCGTGLVLARLHDAFPRVALTGADLSLDALEIARRRVPYATLAQFDIRTVPYEEEFDIVCVLDVIEHLDEDLAALEQSRGALRQGGGIIVSVPQHRWLWSAMDEYGRHRRRYERRRAQTLLHRAGFDVVRTTSYVSLLLPLVAASRLTHRRLTHDYDPFRELRVPSSLNRACGITLAAENALIRRGVSFRVGSSLVLVGRKR